MVNDVLVVAPCADDAHRGPLQQRPREPLHILCDDDPAASWCQRGDFETVGLYFSLRTLVPDGPFLNV